MAKTAEAASKGSDKSLLHYTVGASITPTSFIEIVDVPDVENVYRATYQCGKQVDQREVLGKIEGEGYE